MPTIRRIPKVPRELMNHQKDAIKYADTTDHPALVMDMRTGKTLTVIRWLHSIKEQVKTVLVLAPVAVLEAWEKELRLEREPYLTCYGESFEEREAKIAELWFGETGARFLLMNYEAVLFMGEKRSRMVTVEGQVDAEGNPLKKRIEWRDVPDLGYLPWGAVILDESTRIKNPKAQITKVCTRGFRFAEHRSILTGLPNPEGPLELFTQYLFLDGHFMGYTDFWKWRVDYFEQDRFTWVPKPGVSQLIKDYFHERSFVLPASKAGMNNRTIYQTRKYKMTPKQAKMYNEVEEEYAMTLLSGRRVETGWKLAQRTWLRRIAGGFDAEGKLIADVGFKEWIELLTGELVTKKVVNWFAFRDELEVANHYAKKAGISFVSITGDDDPHKVRKPRLHTFRTTNTRLLNAMVECARYGIDCSVADAAYYYSNAEGNETRRQSIRRIRHPMKKTSDLIIDGVAKGTIAEEILYSLKNKGAESSMFLMTWESYLRRKYGG